MSNLFKEWIQSTGIGLGKPGPPPPKPFQQKQDRNLEEEASHFQWKDDSRGLVLPGYKYLGPFNGLDKGPPVNDADAAAKRHDEAYNELLEQGDNPYLAYNHADEALQEELASDSSFGGNLARGVFQAKKRVLEPLGLVEPPSKKLAPPPAKLAKRPSTNTEERERTPVKQRIREDQVNENGFQGEPSGAAAGAMSSDVEMSAAAGGDAGPQGQGAEGVGNASGDWHCDSIWSEGRVTTQSTRTWVLPTFDNNLYKRLGKSSEANTYNGFKTPWGYLDFNRFHCHFSPRDWQRLINNNWGIRPKRLHVKLFNIQVKEWTTENSITTVANNLTSTIQVFADTNHELPYVMDAGHEGALPPFPNEVFMLPQYGYCGLVSGNTQNQSDYCSFYCLEYFPSKMLRTGNNFELSYAFESVPFHSMYAHSQSLDRLMNPLVDQYLWHLASTTSGNTINAGTANVTFKKGRPPNFALYTKNWMPGPMVKQQNWSTNKDENYKVPEGGSNSMLKYQTHTTLDGRWTSLAPGTCMADSGPFDGSGNAWFTQSQLMFPSAVAQDTGNYAGDKENVYIVSESEVAATNPTANDVYGDAASNKQNHTTAPQAGAWDTAGVYPGMVWQNRDIYYQGPIWAKIPHTDGHFHPSPLMGGFGLKKPPPQIFLKNTPCPSKPPDLTEPPRTIPKINSFINQYSTGQVTVSIEWELQKESSKRWNPEVQFTSNYGNQDSLKWAPDANGKYTEPRAIGSRYLTHIL